MLGTTFVASFGATHKGFDILTERPVVITSLRKAKIASASSKLGYSLQQMRSDATLAIKRTHPAILDIFDQLEDAENYYVISEYTEHPSVSKMPAILTKDDVFSVMSAFDKVVTIIQYLNHAGVYGCCVRQDNVFISPDGEVKIDNIFSSRMNFVADLPNLGRQISSLALSKDGAFLDRGQNERLDLKLVGELLKSLLHLANKKQVRGESKHPADREQAARKAELGLAILPKIDRLVQRLGDENPDRYQSISELAADIRIITAELRAESPDLASVALKASGVRRTYLPGEVLFREGDDPCEEAFIIESGTIQILKNAPDGREIYLDVSQPGDIVGEMALIDKEPRMATARVIEPCTVAVITGVQFRNMLEKVEPISKRLINVLVRRLRYQSNEITRLKSILGVNR